jgi:hypothetical protein
MKLITKLAVLAIIASMLAPHAVYAAKHDSDNSAQSDNSGGDFDDDDGDRKKPKFQTKFFGD